MKPFPKLHRVLIGVAAGALFWSVAYVATRTFGASGHAFAAYAAIVVGVGTILLVH